MSTFGLNQNGFIMKTQADIESSMELYIQQNYFPNFKIRRDSDRGEDQLLITIARELAEQWNTCNALYYAFIPSYAEGVQLDNISEYNNIERFPGVKSVVTCTFTGNAGTVIPVNSIVSVTGTSYRFITTEEITIPAAQTIESDVEAEEEGPIEVLAGTLTVIETPVAGWATVTNSLSEKTLGRYEETDTELRKRREQLIAILGKSSEDSLLSNILLVDNVVDAAIYSNRTNSTDGYGRPAKSFEIIVYGGTSQDIANVIWNCSPAGIETHGTSSQTVTDSTGRTQTVKFTRVSEVSIYIDIELTTNNLYPSNGDDLIKQGIVNYINNYSLINEDVARTKLYCYIYQIPGITNVNHLYLQKGTTSGESETDITIAYNEKAICDEDYITITKV